jgi:hypothetical protein
MTMLPLWLLLHLQAGITIEAPAGCVETVEVEVALAEVGGIDVTELFELRLVPSNEGFDLSLDIALNGAPPLHRDVALRRRDCRDVADLVAVLVQQQRRAANDRVFVPEAVTRATPVSKPTAQPARTSGRAREPVLDCCGAFHLAGTVGPAFAVGARGAVEVGWDFPRLALTTFVAVEAIADLGQADKRGDVAVGVAWHVPTGDIDVSLRPQFGVGATSGGTRNVSGSAAPCASGTTEKPLSGEYVVASSAYLAPAVAARARLGVVFFEVGSQWHIGVDTAPLVYAGIGIEPFAK